MCFTPANPDPQRYQTFFFFFQQKRLSLKPLTLSPSLSLLSSPNLSISRSNPWPPWPKLQSSTQATNTTAMAKTPWFNQQPLPRATTGVALFSLNFSLYLYFSLSFYFFAVVLWFMAKSFSFYCLPVCGFGDLVSFWGLMIWKKKGFWFGFRGVRIECSKGWIFGLGVAMFLRWYFGASDFLWLDVCVLCFM